MQWLHIAVLFLGGVLAAAGFIVSKKPNAKELIAKVVPYQGFIGVALLVSGVLNILNGALSAGVMGIGVVACQVLLGILLGFGLIAQWIPGEGAVEKKGLEIQKKLMGFQVPVGIAAIVFSVLALLRQF